MRQRLSPLTTLRHFLRDQIELWERILAVSEMHARHGAMRINAVAECGK